MTYDISGQRTESYSLPIVREDECGMVFLSCEHIPNMYAAVPISENSAELNESIRKSIETCIRNALGSDDRTVNVHTNGSLTGPTISTMVKFG